MFLGEFRNRLDNKNRVAVPFQLRNELGNSVVVNRYLDGCLAIYTAEAWKVRYDSLMELPTNKADVRAYVRYMTSAAHQTGLDSQGRILIPDNLINSAGLNKDCVFIGAGDHVELWSAENWDKYNSTLTDAEIAAISENL